MDNTKKPTILIVEDEELLREMLIEQFTEAGFITYPAENGELGYKLALDKHPDMTLLDLMLPKMNGIEVLEKIRQDEWGKDARIILLTNVSDPKFVADSLKSNVHEYMVKSDWDIADIVTHIKEKLGITSAPIERKSSVIT